MGACDTLSKPVAAFYEAFEEMEVVQKSHGEIFDESTAMEDKIAFDVELFARRYFSDRTTTPAPMSLRNLPSDTRHLLNRLEAIDGLACRVIDVNDSTYWAILGWDHKLSMMQPFSSPVEDDGLLVGDMRFGEFEGTAILSFSYDQMAIVQSRHVTQSVGFGMVDGLKTMWKSLSLFENFSKGDTDEVIREALKAVERPNEFREPRQNWRLPKMRKPNPWFPHRGARRLYFCAKGWNDAKDSALEFKKGIIDFNTSCTRFKGVITMLENNELFRLKGFEVEDYSPTQWDDIEGGSEDDEDMELSILRESSTSEESSSDDDMT
ncbi:hypothetical protein CCUS01_12241 [Colletotrichum cuscutae]|uniref:Uncharacterized protein n=1 Tax=Colletotrichum cuscutae TaxID=1209917 RepID=A0AAI9TVL9_9PEZI|nr:hypothetical protein CCUS01_12241 [Colletotrichum cuscutae]